MSITSYFRWLTIPSLVLVECCYAVADDIERITVKGKEPLFYNTLQRILPQNTVKTENRYAANQLADLLVQEPAVSFNGQGGQLQVINIRGFSRRRVQTLVEGIPIFTDRRAGSAAEFVAPDFIEQAFIASGAASTYLGSGAIGGGVDFVLRSPDSAVLSAGYGTNQSQRNLTYLDSIHNVDLLVNTRNAANGESADGTPLFDQFEQHSGAIRINFENTLLTEVFSLYSEGNNIGKSASDFPNSRITTYPTNDHWLGKLSFLLNDIDLSVYWHKSRLDTDIERIGSRFNQIRNDSFDYGAKVGRAERWHSWLVNWRAEFQGRADVKATERELTSDDVLVFDNVTLDGNTQDISGVIDASKVLEHFSLAFGARFGWQRLESNQQSFTDANVSGFAGINVPLSPKWSTSFYFSSAYRTPVLSELFFNGESPRGLIIGDPNLETEQGINLQSTLYYKSDSVSAELQLFGQQIDNYIERIEVSEDVLQFRNLEQAEVIGASYDMIWQANQRLDFRLGGQWLSGEDQDGNEVSDISPNQHQLSTNYAIGRWTMFGQVSLRQSKQDFGPSEQPVNSVTVLNAGVELAINNQLSFSMSLNNLTDKEYLQSTDDLSPLARGRDFQFKLTYNL
jgi:iron complex outermembrane receptor protein